MINCWLLWKLIWNLCTAADSECPELAQEIQLNVAAPWESGDSPDREMGVGVGFQSTKVTLSTGEKKPLHNLLQRVWDF